MVGRDHRARRTVGRGVPPSRCSLNRGALSLRNLSGIARPPHYTDGRFFAFCTFSNAESGARNIVRTPVFIGRGRKMRFFSGDPSRGRSPPCRQATRHPRRVSSSSCASRVRMRARVRVRAGALLRNTKISRLISFPFPFLYRGCRGEVLFSLPLSFDMPRGVVDNC